MKKQLLELQKQRDFLRSQLKSQSKRGELGEQFQKQSEKLRKLDGLFSRLCSSEGLKLSKFGRLL